MSISWKPMPNMEPPPADVRIRCDLSYYTFPPPGFPSPPGLSERTSGYPFVRTGTGYPDAGAA